MIFLFAFFKPHKFVKLIKSIRYRDIEVVLRDEEFSEAQKNAEVVRPKLEGELIAIDDKAAQLADVDPAASVIHTWKSVEAEIIQSQELTKAMKFMQPRQYVDTLKSMGKLTQADADLFESLRVIRNSAVHARGDQAVTRVEAMEFRDLSELFIRRLRQAIR